MRECPPIERMNLFRPSSVEDWWQMVKQNWHCVTHMHKVVTWTSIVAGKNFSRARFCDECDWNLRLRK